MNKINKKYIIIHNLSKLSIVIQIQPSFKFQFFCSVRNVEHLDAYKYFNQEQDNCIFVT